MPPFRNPFVRRPPPINGITNGVDENTPPTKDKLVSPSERPGYSSSRASSAVSIKPPKEPDEFKMSGKLLDVQQPVESHDTATSMVMS